MSRDPVPVLSELDLDAAPPQSISRFWLDLVHDAFGEPVRIPVLVARGKEDGPVCGITAAIHGNEVNGIPVIHRVFERLDPSRLRGTLVGVPVSNVQAFQLRQRRTDDGTDLNHLFPGRPDGREAEVYVARFFERVIRRFDLLLDLHTASFGRVNCLYVRADLSGDETARMALRQRPHVIVHNPPHDGTLRGACDEVGIHAITVEIGNPGRFQREYVKRSTIGVRSVLADQGMIPRRAVSPGDPPIICTSSSWLRTDHGGLLEVAVKVTDLVEEGQPVARLKDPFGRVTAEYAAPHAGVVIGHSVDPVAQTGARILHLGRVAPPDDPIVTRIETFLEPA